MYTYLCILYIHVTHTYTFSYRYGIHICRSPLFSLALPCFDKIRPLCHRLGKSIGGGGLDLYKNRSLVAEVYSMHYATLDLREASLNIGGRNH